MYVFVYLYRIVIVSNPIMFQNKIYIYSAGQLQEALACVNIIMDV